VNPDYFKTRYTPDPRRKAVWIEVARHLREYIREDGNLLEIGAGYCDFINAAGAAGKHALDVNPEVREHAAPGVQVHIQDARSIALPAGSFDAVFASNVLEHFDDGELIRLMGGIEGVLKPGGKLILVQPNYRYATREYFDDYTHKKVFSHLSLCDFLVSRGFEILSCKARFLPLSFKSVSLPAPRWLVRLYLNFPWRPFAKQMMVAAEWKGTRQAGPGS